MRLFTLQCHVMNSRGRCCFLYPVRLNWDNGNVLTCLNSLKGLLNLHSYALVYRVWCVTTKTGVVTLCALVMIDMQLVCHLPIVRH